VSTAKEEVRKMLDQVPDDASFKDIQCHIYPIFTKFPTREGKDRGLSALEQGDSVWRQEQDLMVVTHSHIST